VSALLRNAAAASIAAILASLITMTGLAQGGIHTIYFSPGDASCGQIIQAVDAERKAKPRNASPDAYYTGDYIMYKMYALGFLSGANWATGWLTSEYPDALKDIPSAVGSSVRDEFVGSMLWLENYCRQHPLDVFATALVNLRNTLSQKEQK
jgi:hypothetical protein